MKRSMLVVLAAAWCAGPAAAQSMQSGQGGAQVQAKAVGLVQAQARATRHALIIGVGEYLNPAVPSLKGIGHDMESATRMALAMQVPEENIRVLRDDEATAARIEAEITELNARTRPGDRVFFYFSGHGSRWYDASPAVNGCVEALLPADGKPLTNQRVAALLKPISDKADKLFVFYDACHSGGIVDRPLAQARSLVTPKGTLTPKFNPLGVADQCARPANVRTRSFTVEAARQGAQAQNVVQISSSRPDEISFDDDTAGGVATQAWRDCMLGGSRDLDQSGQISVAELAQCAQQRIDGRFSSGGNFQAQHITLGGNANFVPSWFAGAFSAEGAQAAAGAEGNPGATLDDILAQRDPRRTVALSASPALLRIGQDPLNLTVTSSHAGHLYLVLLGSDRRSFYLLFPNDLDRSNAIRAGETLTLPRPAWRIKAQGPAGVDRLLAVVTEAPRDLARLGARRAGPFLQSLTDAGGRATLSWIMGTSAHAAQGDCGGADRARCSDAYGAAQIDIIEQ